MLSILTQCGNRSWVTISTTTEGNNRHGRLAVNFGVAHHKPHHAYA